MILRPYQQTIVESVERGFSDFNRQLVVVPTGGGKTIIFSALAKLRAERNQRTLILAHREELIDQAIEKLHRATGLIAGREKAESSATIEAQVVVASVQSMMRRLDRWAPNHFGLVVCDEAHHVISKSWSTVLNHFAPAHVLGVTATPDRGDKRNLGAFFENIAAEISLFDLIHQGFLAPISVKSVPLEIDISQVNQSAGDYDSGALGDALEPCLGKIAEAIRDHASFRRTLVFVPLIVTSEKFVAACADAGLTARHVDGNSPDRKQILADFAAGKFDVLSNAMLLTEGFDDPGIDCVVILRPTRSRPLYCQMVGRGTRVAPDIGKENLLLLDFLWAHERHNLIRPAHLVSKSDEEAKEITREIQEKSGASQEELDLEGIMSETAVKRHAALRKKLEESSKKKGKLVDAIEWCLRMGNDDLADYEPTMKWERGSISEKQAKVLKRAGIDVSTVSGRGHASKLIDQIFGQIKLMPATDAQKQFMRKRGCEFWETATADDARKFFANLKTQ